MFEHEVNRLSRPESSKNAESESLPTWALDAPPILVEKVGLVRLWRVGREGHTDRTVSEQLCHLSEGSHPERHSIAHRALSVQG